MSKKFMLDAWENRWRQHLQKDDSILHKTLIQNIISIFNGGIKGKKILEIGAGSGIDIVCLAKHDADAYALDYSKVSSKIIKNSIKKEKTKVKIVNADGEKVPFKDDTFDIVFSQGVLEHYKNPSQMITEQIRLLKPNGFLIIDVPQKYSLYTIKKGILKIFKKWLEVELEYTVKDFKSIAQNFDIKLVKIYGWGFYPYRIWNEYFPSKLGKTYEELFQRFEKSRIFPNIAQCIGAVYQKSTTDK